MAFARARGPAARAGARGLLGGRGAAQDRAWVAGPRATQQQLQQQQQQRRRASGGARGGGGGKGAGPAASRRSIVEALYESCSERAAGATTELRDAQKKYATLAGQAERLGQEIDFLSERWALIGLGNDPGGKSDHLRTLSAMQHINATAIRTTLPLIKRQVVSCKNDAEAVKGSIAALQDRVEHCNKVMELFSASTRRVEKGKARKLTAWSMAKVDPQDPVQLQSLRFERPYEIRKLAEPGFLDASLGRADSVSEALSIWNEGLAPWHSIATKWDMYLRIEVPLLNISGGPGIGKSRFLQLLSTPVEAVPEERHMLPEHLQKRLTDGQLKWSALEELARMGPEHDTLVSRVRDAVGVTVSFQNGCSREVDRDLAPEDALCARILYSYFGQDNSFAEFLTQIYTDSLPSVSRAIALIQADSVTRFMGPPPAVILCVDDILAGARMQQDALDMMVLALAEAAEKNEGLLPVVSCPSQPMLDAAAAKSAWVAAEVALPPLSREAVSEAVEIYHTEKSWKQSRWMHDPGALEAFVACGGVPKLMAIAAPNLAPNMGSMMDHVRALMTTPAFQKEMESAPRYDGHSEDAGRALALALSADKMPPELDPATERLLRTGMLCGVPEAPFLPPIVPYIWTQRFGLSDPPQDVSQLLSSFDQVVDILNENRATEDILPSQKNLLAKRSMSAFLMYMSALSLRAPLNYAKTPEALLFGPGIEPFSPLVQADEPSRARQALIEVPPGGLTMVHDFDMPSDPQWEPEPMHVYEIRRSKDSRLPIYFNLILALPMVSSYEHAPSRAGAPTPGESPRTIILGLSVLLDKNSNPHMGNRGLARTTYAMLAEKSPISRWAREERFVNCYMRPYITQPGALPELYEIHKGLAQKSIDPQDEFHQIAARSDATDAWRSPSAILSLLRNSVLLDERDYLFFSPDTVFGERDATGHETASRLADMARCEHLYSGRLAGEGSAERQPYSAPKKGKGVSDSERKAQEAKLRDEISTYEARTSSYEARSSTRPIGVPIPRRSTRRKRD